METFQLFLNINKPGLDNEWNSGITSALRQLSAIEQIQIIEANENSNAQISIAYDLHKLSFSEIEIILAKSGAVITGINIHFPSAITGITDPYSAAAASLKIEEKLKKVKGISGSNISSGGKLKVELDASSNNKQKIFEEIIRSISG